MIFTATIYIVVQQPETKYVMHDNHSLVYNCSIIIEQLLTLINMIYPLSHFAL